MTKKTRLVSLLLAAAVLFAMLFSVVFIAVEAGHDCTAEHCPVCYQIGVCVHTLERLSIAAVAVAIAAAAAYTAVLPICHATARCDGTTLVSLKVKLSI